MHGYSWGGSEELWYRTALLALEKGNQVWVSVHKREDHHPKLVHLAARGASVCRRTTKFFEAEPLLKAAYARQVRPSVWRRGVLKFNHVVWGIPFPPYPKRPPYFFSQALLDLMDFRPDVVCVSQGGIYETAQTPLADLLLDAKLPYLLLCHSYTDREVPAEAERQRIIRLFGAAKKVGMVALHQICTVERQLALRSNNVIQVENPVNLEEFSVVPMPPPTPVQMAIVGSLTVNWKGQDLMLEVLGQPAWQERDWQLNLYGEGPDEAYLKRLAAFYGIAGRVHFHGHAPDIRAIWRANHLLLVPSRQDSGPMVLVEAMLCGRPVLATHVGFGAEWIEEGVNGFGAPAATVPLLSAALEKAWQHRAQWQTLGEHAFAYASARKDKHPEAAFLQCLTS
jgi:glycosyltransferase involved in cell wall biosynthesis